MSCNAYIPHKWKQNMCRNCFAGPDEHSEVAVKSGSKRLSIILGQPESIAIALAQVNISSQPPSQEAVLRPMRPSTSYVGPSSNLAKSKPIAPPSYPAPTVPPHSKIANTVYRLENPLGSTPQSTPKDMPLPPPPSNSLPPLDLDKSPLLTSTSCPTIPLPPPPTSQSTSYSTKTITVMNNTNTMRLANNHRQLEASQSDSNSGALPIPPAKSNLPIPSVEQSSTINNNMYHSSALSSPPHSLSRSGSSSSESLPIPPTPSTGAYSSKTLPIPPTPSNGTYSSGSLPIPPTPSNSSYSTPNHSVPPTPSNLPIPPPPKSANNDLLSPSARPCVPLPPMNPLRAGAGASHNTLASLFVDDAINTIQSMGYSTLPPSLSNSSTPTNMISPGFTRQRGSSVVDAPFPPPSFRPSLFQTIAEEDVIEEDSEFDSMSVQHKFEESYSEYSASRSMSFISTGNTDESSKFTVDITKCKDSRSNSSHGNSFNPHTFSGATLRSHAASISQSNFGPQSITVNGIERNLPPRPRLSMSVYNTVSGEKGTAVIGSLDELK